MFTPPQFVMTATVALALAGVFGAGAALVPATTTRPATIAGATGRSAGLEVSATHLGSAFSGSTSSGTNLSVGATSARASLGTQAPGVSPTVSRSPSTVPAATTTASPASTATTAPASTTVAAGVPASAGTAAASTPSTVATSASTTTSTTTPVAATGGWFGSGSGSSALDNSGSTPAASTDVTVAPTGNIVSNGNLWKLSAVQDFSQDTTAANFAATYPGLGTVSSGKYRDDLTSSVSGGILDINAHHIGSVDAGAWLALLPNGNRNGAWAYTGNVRFSFRIKSTNVGGGYGTAALLSVADNNNWTRDGEMDAWEGSNGIDANSYQHLPGNPTNKMTTNLPSPTDYHTITVEWIGGVGTTYYVDGQQTASYGPSQTASAQAGFMAILQTASADNSDDGAPDTSSSHVYVDWMASWQL